MLEVVHEALQTMSTPITQFSMCLSYKIKFTPLTAVLKEDFIHKSQKYFSTSL